MSVQGNLKEMGVLEILQLIGTQRKSATLRVESGEQRIEFHFHDGLLVACHRLSGGESEPFLETLVGLGHLTPAEAIRLADEAQQSRREIWTAALEHPRLDRELCTQVYLRALEGLIDRALLWDMGNFILLPLAPVTEAISPGLPVESILIDAMRRLDELADMKQGRLTPHAVPCLTGGEASVVSTDPLRRAVCRQIDGRRRMEEIVTATRLGEHEVYEAVCGGIEGGWIQILDPMRVQPVPIPAARRILRPILVASLLVLLLAIGASSAWVGGHGPVDRSPWREAGARWEECDLRAMIEVYRYRTGAYPKSLQQLAEAGLPLCGDAIDRWIYRIEGDAYRLSERPLDREDSSDPAR